MTAESDATLTDTSVNSGTAVDMNATRLQWTFTNFLRSSQGPGKDSASLTRNQRLATNLLLGFNNPEIVADGTIDKDDTTSNRMTFALLKSFCESLNTKSLVTAPFGTIVVDVINAVVTVDFGTSKGKNLAYTLNFRESQV